MIISKPENKGAVRLDKFLSINIEGVSRSKIQRMIKSGGVLVNGKKARASLIVSCSDEVYVKDSALCDKSLEVLKAEPFDLEVIYEDRDFFVINKPFGITIHPSGVSSKGGTLVNKILQKIDKDVGEIHRPGIVHRLDKDTSGALIIAKTKKGYDHFVSQFKDRKIKKIYLALVKGHLESIEGSIESPIGRSIFDRKRMSVLSEKDGKSAISVYKVLKEFKVDSKTVVSLVQVEIKTGRTHQIRVHMSAIKHPIVGDSTYGIRSFNSRFSKEFGLNRQFLHAWKMSFKFSDSKKVGKSLENVNIEAKLPEDLQNVLNKLGGFDLSLV
jgi:23S rRNA pseudouridine1911/1915/1917 synthase